MLPPLDDILRKTREFVLHGLISELKKEVDWRGRGYGRNFAQRTGIYVAALVRDLVRIPLHHRGGLGQARFRARVAYILETGIPTLQFFQTHYPASDQQRLLAEEAIELLRRGSHLICDGRIVVLDEWYATMEEFHELTEYSLQAAEKLEEILAVDVDYSP